MPTDHLMVWLRLPPETWRTTLDRHLPVARERDVRSRPSVRLAAMRLGALLRRPWATSAVADC